jgi:hypothetical protein
MARERGLLPLLTPNSCGRRLLGNLHRHLLLLPSSNPFSFLLLAFSSFFLKSSPPLLSVGECRERESGWTRERVSEWEWKSELVILLLWGVHEMDSCADVWGQVRYRVTPHIFAWDVLIGRSDVIADSSVVSGCCCLLVSELVDNPVVLADSPSIQQWVVWIAGFSFYLLELKFKECSWCWCSQGCQDQVMT